MFSMDSKTDRSIVMLTKKLHLMMLLSFHYTLLLLVRMFVNIILALSFTVPRAWPSVGST